VSVSKTSSSGGAFGVESGALDEDIFDEIGGLDEGGSEGGDRSKSLGESSLSGFGSSGVFDVSLILQKTKNFKREIIKFIH